MKTITVLIFTLMISFGAIADEKSSSESVEKLMALTQESRMIDAMSEQLTGMFAGVSKKLGLSEKEQPAFEKYMQKVSALIKEEMKWETIKEPMVQIYTRHFSEREIQGLITFYSSDIGRSMIEKMPLVMQDSMLISQQMMNRVIPKIQLLAKELQTEIQSSRSGNTSSNQ
jgi:uncharacterized protein